MLEKSRLLVLVLSLTGFVTSFGAYVVAANLPSYSKETGAGLIVIGLLIALYDLAEIFIKPFGALLSRKIGEWAVLRIGLALFIVASGLYLVLPPQYLILVRLLQGAGAAFFSVMSMTLLIRYFMERKGTVLGIYGAFKNAGYVLAPTIGGFFVYYHGFQSIFVLCSAIGLLVIILTYVIRPRSPMTDASAAIKKNKTTPALKDLLDSVKNRRTLPMFLIMFFNMIFMAAFFGFLPVLLSSKGLDPLQAGLFWPSTRLCIWPCNPLQGGFRTAWAEKTHHPGPRPVHPLHFLHSLSSQPLLHRSSLSDGCGHWLRGSSRRGVHWGRERGACPSAQSGHSRILQGTGEMTGPLTMGFVGQALGLQWAFLMVGVVGIGSLICLSFLKEAKALPTLN